MILSERSPERRRQRSGFTITELLVAMSLIIFMMAIFAEAFHVGTDTFHQLKGLGDLQEKLRGATTLLRRDLRADHFDEARGNRLSDQDLTVQGPPSHGFFRIWQGSAPVLEGTDQDSEAGGVEELDPRQIHHDPTIAGLDQGDQPFA